MISEGSCDTEDWSNDAENSAFITGINDILKYIQIQNSYFNNIVIIYRNSEKKSQNCEIKSHNYYYFFII